MDSDIILTPRATSRNHHEGRPTGDRHRRLLIGLVGANPGIHVRRAALMLGLNWNACWHHARRLEREGHLVVRRNQGRLCLFERKSGATAPKLARLLVLEPRNSALVTQILERPGTNQRTLARSLDLAASVVHRRIVQLEAAGLVQRAQRPREMLVFPTEELARIWAGRTLAPPPVPEPVEAPAAAEGQEIPAWAGILHGQPPAWGGILPESESETWA
ncbi:MAG TPA: winged helix-turn-helix transcriptional regulator [Candidatus Thermoplasmatota archaeon]|nr:winged helix-turn-helix transcriptional regulator [Candidatus Thermoplasmatota archaeon]